MLVHVHVAVACLVSTESNHEEKQSRVMFGEPYMFIYHTVR